ncbi:putative glycosyl transferase [Methylorubrum extorquens]|uniref:Putative glycosyl transferase n=1 Tax=Methylorubrum extorquens TaxID=408 RepID=A0A2N9AYB0_METEX|nr:putative glycosyl transferase [Methylorubrum extorquens]
MAKPDARRGDGWDLSRGRETSFSLVRTDDPLFDRRLLLSPPDRRPWQERWIVLTYTLPVRARPQRPLLRLLRSAGRRDSFVLPGVALGAARWLGYLPADCEGIEIAAEPGFVLERVGLRSSASVFAEALLKRPGRVAAALRAGLARDERRWRDSLRGACAVSPLARYPAWKASRLFRAASTEPRSGAQIRLVLPAPFAQADAVARSVASLRAQTHQDWSLLIAWTDGAPPTNPGIDRRVLNTSWNPAATLRELAGGADLFGLLRPGDVLAPEALHLLAKSREAEAAEMVYADEETGGRTLRPRLKPDWSPDLALATGYIGAPALIAGDFLAGLPAEPVDSPDALALTLDLAAGSATRVAHIPRILCRREPVTADPAARAPRLDRHLRSTGSSARAALRDGRLDLQWPLPDPAPLVSIIIPSRDRLDLIARVTKDVLEKTPYPALELVIVDNGSKEPAVLDLYERLRLDPRVRIEPYPHPFNFSALVNAGARKAGGDVLVLLNNDVAVLRPDWLDVLVAQAVRPEVGAVGAKLLYEDGRLQHVGVVVGLGGEAGHILRRRPADTLGHLDRLSVAHEVSGVTAACLAVTREKYQAVGGFDEETFAVDFNDIDFCLRLGARGWKTVWTPHAVLSHLESVSRGRPVGDARARFEREAVAFTERWRDVIRHDPFYHPALSLTTFGEELE